MRDAALGLTISLLLLAGCGRTSPVNPPPAPAPVVVSDPLPATLEEAQKLRRDGDLERYERALQALTAGLDPEQAGRAKLTLALFLHEQQRHADAVPALELAAAALPAIAPFLNLRVIDAEERRGRFDEARRLAQNLVANAGQTSAATVAALRLPLLNWKAGDAAGTIAALQSVDAIAIDELSEPDFVRLAGDFDTAGRSDLAQTIWMRLLTTFPQGRNTEQTYARAGAALDAITYEETLNMVTRLSRNDRYDQSLDLLGRIVARHPAALDDPAFRGARIRALFSSRHYDELLAETADWKLTEPPLLLLRARAAWRSDRPEEFLDGLKQIEKDHPSSKEALDAKVLRAKYYSTDEPDYAKSVANLETAVSKGVLGNDGENLWTLGWTFTLWGKTDQALRIFEQYIRTYPDGDYKTNSLFWSAKIFDSLGRTEERDARLRQIMAEYPYSYYSYRSREILGETTSPPLEVDNGNTFPDLDAEIAAAADDRISLVRELLAYGLTREATREMKRIASTHPQNRGVAFMLADVYVQGGEAFKANSILQRNFRQFVRHGGKSVPSRFWEILFPLNYWTAIQVEAEKRQLDPYLVASIIRQESGFEPSTVSNAGAVGLMQIMPGEAGRIALAAGLGELSRDHLFDPEQNIAVGAAEYSQKLAIMQGNHILAIAAYNAGEKAVGRWLALTPIEDMDRFIESIPFAETRLYVKSVTRNRFEYRRIYAGSTISGQQHTRSLSSHDSPRWKRSGNDATAP